MSATSQAQRTPTWFPNTAAPDDLQEAFLQAHSAVQWLARLANSFCVPASDASHLHMVWRDDHPAIVTQEFAPDTVAELRLPHMVLQFIEQGERTDHEVQLDEMSPAQIEAWTLIELLHRRIDRDAYSKALPYDVSHLLAGDAHDYHVEGKEQAHQDMTDWLTQAGIILNAAVKEAANTGLGDTPGLKFAPETFSLFVRLYPEEGHPSVSNCLELGFCAGTTSDTQPHFYSTLARDTARQSLSTADIVQQNLTHDDIVSLFALPSQADRLKAQ